MKKTSTTLDRKALKKWLTCPALAIVLALLLVLSSLPVYAGEQQTEQTETPTVTQDASSESAQSATSSEPNEPLTNELDAQNAAIVATTKLPKDPPHEGAVLNGGYVGFKNKDSDKYLTIPNGSTTVGTNVCQQDANRITNAQEFYLSYTHNTDKNISYFTIQPVDVEGNVASTRVKSAAINTSTGVSNVSLQYFMPTEFTDRWQIEHYEDNYYIIHIASKPYESGSRYVLCAQPGEGSAVGSGIYAQGNVFVTTLTANSTPSDSMLWQICADGMPMDINSNDISDGGSYDVDETDELIFYYIPKSFNQSLTWLSSNSYSVTTPNTLGKTTAIAPGKSTIKMEVRSATGTTYETAEIYVKLPNGVYYLRNVSTQMLLDLDKDAVNSGTSIQVYNGGTGEPTNFSQLYKFYYLGNGLYSIRPMRKNNMGISWSLENQSATLQDIGTSNSSVPNTGQWYLNKNSNGM
ncbi:MAG: RICIN domain-containing protein [Clostridia bacterium]|nr:RICIN domain-containing protein [Clostridia bacterium]